jgi:hypothetical protein
MYYHGTSCLEGPVTRSRGWWTPENDETDGIRHELVARIRREIAAGEYDTPAKMEIALARLLQELE